MEQFSQYRMVFTAAVQKLEQLEEQRLRYKISLENERERLSDDRTELLKEKAGCYEQYAMGDLDKDTFLLEKKTFEEKDCRIKDRLEEIRSNLQTLVNGAKPIHQQMKELAAMDVGQEVSTEFAEEFLENIQVFNNDRVEIHWKYTDEIEQILSMDKGDECFGC